MTKGRKEGKKEDDQGKEGRKEDDQGKEGRLPRKGRKIAKERKEDY